MSNRKLSEVFQIVLDNWDTKTIFVCSRLLKLEIEGKISFTEWYKASSYIDTLLTGYSTVTAWLCNNHQEVFESIHFDMNTYRKAWVEHMIQELKKEGH